MQFNEYISLIAIIISIISFGITIYDKSIKIIGTLSSDLDGDYFDIYNQSNRKITISYFEIYASKSRLFSKRTYADTWYNDNYDEKYVILPYEYKQITFDQEYSLKSFLQRKGNKHVYAAIYISGKYAKTIKLR